MNSRKMPHALGRALIEVPGYKFSAFVTTLDLPPAEIWRLTTADAIRKTELPS